LNKLGLTFFIHHFPECFFTLVVCTGSDIPQCSLADVTESSRQQLEADCFWCFSKLLDGIQDNYTFAQPGIQRRISSLKELVSRIDGKSVYYHAC